MHFSYEITLSTKGKELVLLLSNLTKVISLGLVKKLCKFILLYTLTKGKRVSHNLKAMFFDWSLLF